MTPERWRRIEALYHAALMRPERERAAFLDTACDGDEALRHEVESLLAQPASDGVLATGGAAVAALPLVNGAPHSMMLGRRLGIYQVQSLLGAGGMGEVYRARDTRLGRDVAVKILPRAFTSDSERLARFEREARVLASLNHPNIGAIYGLEEAEGVRALVLELIAGETLADRLTHVSKRKAPLSGLPIADALAIARQIADALDAAHEKGIVHRDLKPANVKITPEGIVKVLDFGLAKVHVANQSDPDLTQSPTVTVSGTRDGLIMGTAAYMSPEQARGLMIDKRTDIWAFGCVMYEMLTGHAAFARETISDTIAAILERVPEWSALPGDTPASLRRLLQRCLEKNPKRRIRDIGDIQLELEDIATARRAVFPFPTRDGTGLIYSANPTSVDLALWWRPLDRAEPTRLTTGVGEYAEASMTADGRAMVSTLVQFRQRLTAFPMSAGARSSPRHITDGSTGDVDPALSPEGDQLVFSSARSGFQNLWTARLDGTMGRALTSGNAFDERPAFSPDGRQLAFVSDRDGARGIWIMSAEGGVPEPLVKAQVLDRLLWSPDGRGIVYATTVNDVPTLQMVSVADGTVKRVPTPGPALSPFGIADGTTAYLEPFPGGKGQAERQPCGVRPHHRRTGVRGRAEKLEPRQRVCRDLTRRTSPGRRRRSRRCGRLDLGCRAEHRHAVSKSD